jgi:hypothetical protein
MVTRHVWQDALDEVTAFTKPHNGKRLAAFAFSFLFLSSLDYSYT